MSAGALTRRRALLITVTAAVIAAGTGPHGQAGQKRTSWRDYGGGPDNARYIELDQINRESLPRLSAAWTYPTHDNLPYNFGPLVVDGVAYVLARNTSLVALDAATGREIWIHADLQGIAPRGINYWESSDRQDRRLLFQRNNYLEAIDARTGKSILSFGTDGAVDLKQGYARDPSTLTRVQSSNPGKVFENLIILGSATGEGYLSTPGDIRAYDVVTGKEAWRFHTIPHPGEFGYDTWPPDAWKYIGGTNTWGELTVDAERGIVFLPTGSPTYDLNKGAIKWQVPAGGDEPVALAQGGRDTGFIRIRTGIISTSAGLVFHAGGDGKLRAYDAGTGRVWWTGSLPAGLQGIPAMYESGGRQFILVNATQIGSGYIRGQTRPGEAPSGGYVAFALKPPDGS